MNWNKENKKPTTQEFHLKGERKLMHTHTHTNGHEVRERENERNTNKVMMELN